jgi:NAD(P)-dependent dehydrogenase (short-subunit alcohol dehydrogenase family)
MSQSLAGRAAIVTGAGQGVGQGVARALAAAGANILIAQRSSDSGEAEAAHLRQTHKVDAHFLQNDVTDQAQVERMVETGVKLFGKVDILVNNAGASKAIRSTARELPRWTESLQGALKKRTYRFPSYGRNMSCRAYMFCAPPAGIRQGQQ